MLWIALTIAFVAILAGGAVSIAWFSMHPPRLRIRHTPERFGAKFEEVTFCSGDGTRLEGWWIPAAKPRAALVLCHGMAAHREQMLPWAVWLWKAGFSLLLFDFRSMGMSGGNLCTMGLREPDDVIAAVDHIAARRDAAGLPIGGLGFSMGGVALMLATAREPRIRAISTLGSYTSLETAITQRCRRHFGRLGPVVEKPARRLGARWFPGDPASVDCLRAVASFGDRPVLFATGLRDPIVLPSNAEDLYAAASGAKELLKLPNTAHDYPRDADGELYEARVLAFFCESFK
jgi:uncharacterized protein